MFGTGGKRGGMCRDKPGGTLTAKRGAGFRWGGGGARRVGLCQSSARPIFRGGSDLAHALASWLLHQPAACPDRAADDLQLAQAVPGHSHRLVFLVVADDEHRAIELAL